jgi:flagellar biosynthetic protein FliO
MDDLFLSTVRVILVLAGILAAILVLRKYADRLKLPIQARRSPYGLRKVDSVSLGYKKFVSVVEVRDRVLVVGVGEKEVNLLCAWEKEEASE